MTNDHFTGFGQRQGSGRGRGQGMGRGSGRGRGQGGGRGFGGAGLSPDRRDQHEKDRHEFQTLLARHDRLQRNLECLPNGIRAVTTSDDPELVPLIQHHVRRMHQRMLENWPVRRWDTLYIEIFKHRDEIEMEIRDLENGVWVEETSDNPRVAELLHAHGKTVNAFVEQGFNAARHPAPLPDGHTAEG